MNEAGLRARSRFCLHFSLLCPAATLWFDDRMPSQEVNALQHCIEEELRELMELHPTNPPPTAAMNFQFDMLTLTFLGDMPVTAMIEASTQTR